MDKITTDRTVREIINTYLEEKGFDGLYSDMGKCGCLADDLIPCEYFREDCRVGYKNECPTGLCAFHIMKFKDAGDDNLFCEG